MCCWVLAQLSANGAVYTVSEPVIEEEIVLLCKKVLIDFVIVLYLFHLLLFVNFTSLHIKVFLPIFNLTAIHGKN